MSSFLNKLTELYQERLAKHRNRPFLQAAMAACALVAMANGNVSFRQRIRIDQVMETLEALRTFDPHEGVNLFNECVTAMQNSPRTGHKTAMELILKETLAHPEKAELLIRICLAVSEVDGVIPMTEQIEIVGLCGRLGIQPDRLGLYPDREEQVPQN
jgi:tellurite resistance protein